MTNEEKARKIARIRKKQYKCYDDAADKDGVCYFTTSEKECEKSALQMAEWKDKQFVAKKQALIDKVCMLFEKKINLYVSAYGTESSAVCVDKSSFISYLRKAMEK